MTHTSFYKNGNFSFFVGSGGCGDLQQHNVHNKCWKCIFLQTIDMFKLYASSCLTLQCIRWTWSGTLAVNSSGLVECWVGPSMVSNKCPIWLGSEEFQRPGSLSCFSNHCWMVFVVWLGTLSRCILCHWGVMLQSAGVQGGGHMSE